MPASASIAAARALASACVIVQRFERPRLAERILAAEQQLALAADRVAHVLELELVRVRVVHLDPFGVVPASRLDARVVAVPRVVEEERALAADCLELVALG